MAKRKRTQQVTDSDSWLVSDEEPLSRAVDSSDEEWDSESIDLRSDNSLDVPSESVDPSLSCTLCHGTDDAEDMIVCDECQRGMHMTCMGWTHEQQAAALLAPQFYCARCQRRFDELRASAAGEMTLQDTAESVSDICAGTATAPHSQLAYVHTTRLPACCAATTSWSCMLYCYPPKQQQQQTVNIWLEPCIADML